MKSRSKKQLQNEYIQRAHMFVIRNINTFLRDYNKNALHTCYNCLTSFTRSEALQLHKENGCYEYHTNKEKTHIDPIKAKHNKLGKKSTYIIYDYESFLKTKH